MKSLVCSAVLVVCLSPLSAWAIGNEGSGGGDLCEARFKSVARDINSWIEAGGANGLDLSVSQRKISLAQYTNAMKKALAHFRVTCVGKGDPGYPVIVNGQAKECRSYRAADGSGRVLCDRAKFYSNLRDPDNNADQYRIVHHEFATLADLEVPRGADSQYWLSEQITGFLSRQTVLKLAVKPRLGNDPKLGEYSYTLHTADFSWVLSPDRKHFAFNSDAGITVRDLVTAQNVLTIPKTPERVDAMVYSAKGDVLFVFDRANMLTNHIRCFDTASGREKFRLAGVGEFIFPKDGQNFISLTGKATAEVRSLADGHLIREYKLAGLPQKFFYVAKSVLSPDERQLMVNIIDQSNPKANFIGRLYALDLASGQIVYSAVGGAPAYRADGKMLALSIRTEDGLTNQEGRALSGILFIDPVTGRQILSRVADFDNGPQYLSFLRDGRLMATYQEGQETKLLSGENYSELLNLPGAEGFQMWRHMDEKQTFYLADLSTHLNLAAFDLRTGRVLAVVDPHDDSFASYVLSQDRALAITQDASNPETSTIRILEIPAR